MAELSPLHLTHQRETESKAFFGFWVYVMTDCMLFACLFAAYAVLHNNTYGGPSSRELFNQPFVLAETMALLISSFTCGMAMLAGARNKKNQLIAWFAVTFLLGLSFVVMEVTEFRHLVQEGHSWQESAFLTSFFTLVGTHGLHVSLALLWMIVLVVPIFFQGLTPVIIKRLLCLRLFWHFLDVVWIFIFTFVYLMGA